MSRNGDTLQSLGGEKRQFRFGLAEHRRLQEALHDKLGLSLIVQNLHPFALALAAELSLREILTARMLGDIRIEQVREVIFQGLIGGGMSPQEAGRVCFEWVDSRPLTETAPVAYAVGMAALIGPPDEDAVGEQQGGEAAPPSQMESSGSAKTESTPSARPAVTRRRKSSK